MLKIYIITVMISMFVFLWAKHKIQNNVNLIDIILHSESKRNFKNPLMYVFVPILNIICDIIIIWVFSADINKVEKFFKDN